MTTPVVAADLTSLISGQTARIASAIAAAQTLAANAGIGSSLTNPRFGVDSGPTERGRTLNLHGSGISSTGAPIVPTTVTASLYSSSDGGVTWNLYQAAIPLGATTIFTDVQVLNVVPGLLYQILITTLTLGSASSVSVDATLS